MRFLRYRNTLKAVSAAVALALAVSQPALAANNQVELVPDDTLFYFGTGKPVPVEDFFSLLPSAFSPELIKLMLPDLGLGSDEATQKITDFLDDPTRLTNEWGLGDELQFTAYTIGIMPVFRIAGEGEKFEAAFARATAEHAENLETLTHKGIDVQIAPLDDKATDAPSDGGPSISSLKNTKTDLESGLAEYAEENAAAQSALDAANANLDAAKESNNASGIAEAANQIAQAADTVAKTTLRVTETEQELATLDTQISDAEKKQLADGKSGPGLITAAANGDLVFAMAANAYDPDVLDQILGLTKPESSLENSGKLKDIRKEWGYGDEVASYVDFKLIADAVTGGDSLAARQIKALDAAESGEFSQFSTEPCKSEIRQVAENWPMMVAGNRLFEVKDDIVNFDSHFALIMQDESLRDTLKLLSGAVPASQSNSEALLSMGLGINVDTAPQLVAQLTEILAAIDFQCAPLQDINQLGEFDISSLSLGAMMFSGMARGVSGISFNLYDGEFDSESPIPVKGIDSAIAIAAEDPSSLVQSHCAVQW